MSPLERLQLECRRLFLRGLEVRAVIGIHPHEKQAPQRVLVDVDVWVPLARSTPRADAIEEVVDYDFVREVVHERVALGPIALQETLCDAIARRILEQPAVAAVRVSTRKPDVYPDCEAVGVEVFHLGEAAPR